MELRKNSFKWAIKEAYLSIPKKGVFTIVKKLIKPNKNFYWYLRFRGDFTVPIDESHSFRLKSHGSSVENSIFWAGITGEWEAASMKLWIKLSKDAETVFDVGANTGIYALVAKAVNPGSKVYAFEPIKRIFEILIENNELNNYDIVCMDYAISNKDDTTIIYDIPHDQSYSSSLNSNFVESKSYGVVPTTVETIRLDSLIRRENLSQLNLMKIDVETFEPQVLEGLGEYLKKFKPTMLIEILSDDVARQVEQLVSGNNYLFFDVNDDNGSIKKVERLTKSSSFNYLICVPEVAARIGILK